MRACGFGCGLVRGRVGRMQARDCTAVLQAEHARLEEGGLEVIGAFVRVLARTGEPVRWCTPHLVVVWRDSSPTPYAASALEHFCAQVCGAQSFELARTVGATVAPGATSRVDRPVGRARCTAGRRAGSPVPAAPSDWPRSGPDALEKFASCA